MLASDLNDLETRARQKALESITQEFQKPDQLDKLDRLRKQYERRKNTTEAQLKSAIQGQLDGVRNGLAKLDRAYQESDQIRKRMLDVGETFEQLSGLTKSLERLREQCEKHTQLASAIENMSSLVSVPDDIASARDHIQNAKTPNLLLAHQIMQKVEGCRDEVMLEIFRSDPKSHGLQVIKTYFANLDLANEEMKQQIVMMASRILDIIRHEENHGMVVSALRIVDREERADAIWEERSKSTGFMPLGRPKRLKEAFFKRIGRFIEERISGSQLDTRGETKLWLARHLEIIRRFTVDDLRVVKTLGPIFFPPDYKVFETFAAMYHDAIGENLQELIEQLDDREVTQLLMWLNTYKGVEMMGNPFLRIKLDELSTSHPPTLLSAKTLASMQERYFNFLRQNIGTWFPSSLDKDYEDWMRKDVDPDSDAEGFFYTSLVINMMDITKSNIGMSNKISPEMAKLVLKEIILEIRKFADTYHKKIELYIREDELKKDEERHPLLVKYLVANINNCTSYANNILNLVKEHAAPGTPDLKELSDLARETSRYYSDVLAAKWLRLLVENIFVCLKDASEALVTDEWFQSGFRQLVTMQATIRDFNMDLIHLQPKYYRQIIGLICTKVIALYLRAITATSKRMKFKPFGRTSNSALENRLAAGDLLLKERDHWEQFFKKEFFPDMPEAKEFTALDSISDIIRSSDTSITPLDVNVLLKNCPDCDKKQLSDILTWREDLSYRQIEELVDDAHVKTPGGQNIPQGAFTVAKNDGVLL